MYLIPVVSAPSPVQVIFDKLPRSMETEKLPRKPIYYITLSIQLGLLASLRISFILFYFIIIQQKKKWKSSELLLYFLQF